MKKTKKTLAVLSAMTLAVTSIATASFVYAVDDTNVSETTNQTIEYEIDNDEYKEIIDRLIDNRMSDEFAELIYVPGTEEPILNCNYMNSQYVYMTDYYENTNTMIVAVEHFDVISNEYLPEPIENRTFLEETVKLSNLSVYDAKKSIIESDVRAFLDENNLTAEIAKFDNNNSYCYITLAYNNETLDEKIDTAIKLYQEFNVRPEFSVNAGTDEMYIKRYYDNNMTYEDIQSYYPKTTEVTTVTEAQATTEKVTTVITPLGTASTTTSVSTTAKTSTVITLLGTEPDPTKIGDADLDGEVTLADTVTIIKYNINPAVYPMEIYVSRINADINGDHFINNNDVAIIIEYFLKKISYEDLCDIFWTHNNLPIGSQRAT